MPLDQWDEFDDFDKSIHKAGRAFAALFIFCAILGLAMLGTLGWALITLISWVTTK